MQTMVNIAPMTCTAIMTAPIGGDWFIEPKLDGARILAHVHEDRVEFQTRTSKSQTGKFPEIEEALRKVLSF
jgi:ATP-dependent DNA ligase